MWEGTLCLENTWRRKSFVSSGDVIMSCIGMNMHCLDSQSTTIKTAIYPEDKCSCSMKSMKMEFQGFSRMGSCFSNLQGLCLGTFTQAQKAQDKM